VANLRDVLLLLSMLDQYGKLEDLSNFETQIPPFNQTECVYEEEIPLNPKELMNN